MGLGLGSVVGLGLAFGLNLRLGLVSGLYKNLAILLQLTARQHNFTNTVLQIMGRMLVPMKSGDINSR